METVQFYILAGLSGISIALCAILFHKLRSIIYLLEQPVVKKMSPALKLKPVKVDEIDTQSTRNDSRPVNANGNRGPRPNFERPEGGERQNRDGQSRQDRGPRPERTERPEGNGERGAGGDRGPRNDRFSGRDRDRGPRNDRHERHGGMGGRDGGSRDVPGNREGGDRNRHREPFVNGNEAIQPESAPMASRPAPVPAPDNSHTGPVLAPRRPLPSTVDQEGSLKDFTPPNPVSEDVAADAMFMRDDSDIQHGRRTQLKKKPRFEISDEDAKTAAPEESKA